MFDKCVFLLLCCVVLALTTASPIAYGQLEDFQDMADLQPFEDLPEMQDFQDMENFQPLEHSQQLNDSPQLEDPHAATLLVRQVRSPQGQSVDLGLRQDQFGRSGSIQYNRNLYTSDNGRFNVDGYAHAARNFDYNRNDFGGGVRASWRF